MREATMEKAWTATVEEALDHFHVRIAHGLSKEQVEANLRRYGTNGVLVCLQPGINL